MKKIYFYLFVSLVTQLVISQDYVEIAKMSYGTVFNAGYDNSDNTTNVSSLDVGITYPIKLNEKAAIISGLDYGQYGLDLFPDSKSSSLNFVRIKAGINLKHGDRWSGTYVLLPKIAGEDLNTDGNSFFFGGLAVLKYQKNDHFQYRFGAYGSSEGFGVLATPVLGLYYLSEDKKWESTVNLPINGDVNYRFNEAIAIGLGFQAPVRSYSLKKQDNLPEFYVQSNIIELGFYVEHGFMDKSLLFRLQGGYTSVSYEVFEEGDTLPIRISAFEFGDDRNLLNPEMNGGFFAKVNLIYRFHLNKQKK